MQSAGVMPILRRQNDGPEGRHAVGSPGSRLPGVFSGVGTQRFDDEVAFFSGRGPSPWKEIKPYVVAPGVSVLSSVTGGLYEEYQGTSMATAACDRLSSPCCAPSVRRSPSPR
jgi:bacillopeptidase F